MCFNVTLCHFTVVIGHQNMSHMHGYKGRQQDDSSSIRIIGMVIKVIICKVIGHQDPSYAW
jgi:hypothetical protein